MTSSFLWNRLTATVALLLTVAAGMAQPAAAGSSGLTFSSFTAEKVEAPVLRTVADFARDVNLRATNPVAPGAIIDRPTIPLEVYRTLKLRRRAKAALANPEEVHGSSSETNVTVQGPNFDAAFEDEDEIVADDFYPSDSIIAAGATQIVEVTNSFIDVWNKSDPSTHEWITQNNFVASTDSLGDGRVIYDWNANRWIVTITDFTNLTGGGKKAKPVLFLAVSNTSDASSLPGGWNIYALKVQKGGKRFFDFPQLGQDANALLLTVNLFAQNGKYVGPSVFTIPKSAIYANQSFTFGLAVGKSGIGTVTPPNVIAPSGSGADYFLAAPVGNNSSVLMYAVLNAGTSSASISRSPAKILVNPYSTPPPLAEQTCDAGNPTHQNALDTIDGRFQNDSIQNGNLLWNAHTIADPNLMHSAQPIVRWYEIQTDTQTVRQWSNIHLTPTSYDFNPSIASAGNHAAVLNWTATDPNNPNNKTDAAMVMAGRQSSDQLNSMTLNSTPVVISSACMTSNFDPSFGFQRWGDYSAVSLDNSNGSYWLVNQFTAGDNSSNTSNYWATRIARVTNP